MGASEWISLGAILSSLLTLFYVTKKNKELEAFKAGISITNQIKIGIAKEERILINEFLSKYAIRKSTIIDIQNKIVEFVVHKKDLEFDAFIDEIDITNKEMNITGYKVELSLNDLEFSVLKDELERCFHTIESVLKILILGINGLDLMIKENFPDLLLDKNIDVDKLKENQNIQNEKMIKSFDLKIEKAMTDLIESENKIKAYFDRKKTPSKNKP